MQENPLHIEWLKEPIQLVGMAEKQPHLAVALRRNLESAAEKCKGILQQNPESWLAKNILTRIAVLIPELNISVPDSTTQGIALSKNAPKKAKPTESSLAKKFFYGTLISLSALGFATEVWQQLSPKKKNEKVVAAKVEVPEKKEVSAQDFFDSIPENIPGAEKDGVKKKRAEGAKHCFVSIRNIHRLSDYELTNRVKMLDKYLNNEERKLLQQFLKSDEYSQLNEDLITNGEKDEKDIQKILEFLFQKGAKHISTEGYTNDEQNIMDLSIESYRGNPQRTDEDKEVMKMQYDALQKAFGSAVANILLNKDITVHPGEDKRIYKKTGQLMQMRANPTVIKTVHEEREDVVVTMASKRSVTVQIFGGSHDFSDAVSRWNHNHPNDKVSFIEITPAAFKASTEESKKNPFGLVFVNTLAKWEMKHGRFVPWDAVKRDLKNTGRKF